MVKNKSSFTLLMNTPNLEDVRQTKQYACFMEKIGWKVVKIGCTGRTYANVSIKRLPFLPFSVIKILRYNGKLQLSKVKKLVKDHWAILIKFESLEIEKISGPQIYFKVNNKWPLTPTKTLWIDLAKSEKTILLQMKAKTRYNIKMAERNSLDTKIISGEKITKKQLQDFYEIWRKNKPHSFLFKPSFNELASLVACFEKKCFWVFVYNKIPLNLPLLKGKNSLVGACLILTSKNMAFYWHNTSSLLGKKLFAPTLCVWEAIKETKKRDLKVFDFEGVWDERFPKLNKGWKGFSRFKERFAGN